MPATKLSAQAVRAIRADPATPSLVLAQRYGVSRQTIDLVRQLKNHRRME